MTTRARCRVVSGTGGCVFRDSPRGARRAGGERLRGRPPAAALGRDSTERRRGGIPNTLTSSGSGLKQSAFASAFSRIAAAGGGSLFFFPHVAASRSPGGDESRKARKPVG